MTGRLLLLANEKLEYTTLANAKDGEVLTSSSSFFKLETPLHLEKEFDDDDVISSSSKPSWTWEKVASVKSDVKFYSGWLKSFQSCINPDEYCDIEDQWSRLAPREPRWDILIPVIMGAQTHKNPESGVRL